MQAAAIKAPKLFTWGMAEAMTNAMAQYTGTTPQPGQFARLCSKARKPEEGHEYIVVNDFHADVSIK